MNTDKKKILDSIDACRPGSDDLYLPEMSELADALAADPQARQWYDDCQALDTSLTEAFRDVPVPAGLEDRLLNGLAGGKDAENHGSDCDSSIGQAVQLQNDTATGENNIAPADQPHSRRQWLRWTARIGGGVAVLGLLTVGLFYWLRPDPILTSNDVVQQTNKWTEQVSRHDFPWSDKLSQAPAKYAFDDGSIKQPPTRWQRIETDLDRRAVAYDLRSHTSQPTAVLFVIDIGNRQTADLPGGPNFAPSSETGGWCVGAWRKGNKIYVLAVHGDKQRFRSFINVSILG